MKYPYTTAAAALLVLTGVGSATLPARATSDTAAERSAIAEELSGTIAIVAEDGTSFVLETEGRDVTIEVNERTEYTLDGKASTRERALRAGRAANVRHEGQVAAEVDVTSERGA